MVAELIEREDKYEVAADWLLPDLADVVPSGARLERCEASLSSRYFDTAGGDLLGHGITLRLRSGDADAGWQLKVPDGRARAELRLPAGEGRRAVPPPLRDVVYGIAGGAALRSVAQVDTTRTMTRVVDAGGELLAEVDDDLVTARPAGNGAEPMRWREVEVELGAADERLLARIGRRLIDAGAARARAGSKLGRLLGPQAPSTPPGHTDTLGDLVTDYLRQQHAALLAGDLALRRGMDAAHPTRVATRRYRSVLRIFADLFDAEPAAALDAELAWYAGLLGAVRDQEVLGRHLDQTLAGLPAPIDPQPVAADLHTHMENAQQTARRRLDRQMRTKRYLNLLATLDQWQHPPLTAAAEDATSAVTNHVDRANRILAKRLRRAAQADADDEALHRARKAGKRARYTAEVAVPALGKPARRIVKRATALQDTFGAHQDSVLAADLLLRLGTASERNAFGYGVLYCHERERLRASRQQARELATGA